MSLNTINLSKNDLALLYKKSLVEINSENSKQKAKSVSTNLKFLGENKKKVLIVVMSPEVVHIPDKQLAFLTKLLSACNLNLGDVAIINFHHYQASDYNDILNYFQPKAILLFGISPADFGMPILFPEFQVQNYKNAAYVFSPSLDTIEPDKAIKTKLWVSLKKIFSV